MDFVVVYKQIAKTLNKLTSLKKRKNEREEEKEMCETS
jgi:hypothetical protein